MLTLETQLTVGGLTGWEITDFLLDPQDGRYRAWWPGTHLAFHPTEEISGAEHIGEMVLMDEYVGSRRIRMVGEVVEADHGQRIVWRMHLWRVRLPVRLTLTLRTTGPDVRVRHTITAGWTGPARALDALWRLYFSPSFAGALDCHVRTEFLLLRELLHRGRPESSATSVAARNRQSGDVR